MAGRHELRVATGRAAHLPAARHTNPRWAGIPDLDDAGPRAVAAYLRTYGPATLEHVHYWLGSGLSAGRRRLDRWVGGLGDQLAAVDVGGTTAYVVRDDVPSLLDAPPSEAVRFLPGHDQWVRGPRTSASRRVFGTP